MKTLLLHIGDDDAMESRLEVALDLARAHGSHLVCHQSVSYEMFTAGDFYGSAIAAALPVIREAAERLREKIEADLENEGVPWEWITDYGMAEYQLLERSALADLVIVGPHDVGVEGKRPSRLAGYLALHGRTPVMVVPQQTKGFDASAPVLVGWNGSSEVCIAIRQSLPLLRSASAVYLACVREARDRERADLPPLEGAQYLSRHGIESEIVEIDKGDGTVAQALFADAAARKCGALVMGAYGHSRLAELLLGGVTREVLKDPRLPIVLAH